MTEKEIQPIALDGKIIDFKTKEVIEDLDMKKNKKRFTICVDSNNLKSLWDDERTEEEPLLWLTLSDRIGGIDDVCDLLNEFNDENKQLHRIIIEDEKMTQSIYEELSKLRIIKKNLREIKTQWNWIMESVDYD